MLLILPNSISRLHFHSLIFCYLISEINTQLLLVAALTNKCISGSAWTRQYCFLTRLHWNCNVTCDHWVIDYLSFSIIWRVLWGPFWRDSCLNLLSWTVSTSWFYFHSMVSLDSTFTVPRFDLIVASATKFDYFNTIRT